MDVLNSFFHYITDELAYSAHTVTAYRNDIEQWCAFVAPGVAMEKVDPMGITTNDTRAWVATLAREGLSTASVKRKLSSVRALYRFMVKRRGVDTNPVAPIRINRREKALPKFIDASEMEHVLDALDSQAADSAANYKEMLTDVILNILYQSGMRASELVALTDERVDMGRSELKVLGKRNKERIIPFAPGLGRVISMYLEARPTAYRQGQPFLVNEAGEPLNYQKVYHIVRKALDGNVSSTKRSPHVLRHTFATDMLNGGADLTSVRKLLGHTSLATTQIYTHVSVAELHDSYNKAHPRARRLNKTESTK